MGLEPQWLSISLKALSKKKVGGAHILRSWGIKLQDLDGMGAFD